jgi:hypothetical protein
MPAISAPWMITEAIEPPYRFCRFAFDSIRLLNIVPVRI